jgi:ADP-ribose pyrophosphatase
VQRTHSIRGATNSRHFKSRKARFFPRLILMPNKFNTAYLRRLPEESQTRGDASAGQVEIVTGQKEVKEIESQSDDKLKGSAIAKTGSQLGIVLEDSVHMFVRDATRFPSGATKCQIRIVGKTEYDGPNGVAVLCMSEGQFVLREIFRHATRSWELETTRGRREKGQTPRQAVRAEVKQELGYSVKKIHLLGMMRPDSSLMSGHLEVFLAELGAAGKPEPEPTEAFGEIVKLTADELGASIVSGYVRDSYTIGALLMAQLRGLIPPVVVRG